MQKIVILLGAVYGILFLPSFSSSQVISDITFKDEPEAHALYDSMLAVLQNAETIYFESEYRREAKGTELGHAIYKIWMKKPNYVRLEATSYNVKRKGVLVGDGEYFWIYWPSGAPWVPAIDPIEYKKNRLTSYMKKPAPAGKHSIAHQTNLLGVGMSMTILELSIFHGCSEHMEPYLDGVRSLGIEKIGEEECNLIEVSFMDHQRIRYFWLSKYDNLPRKLKEVVRVSYEIHTDERWSNIKINGEIPVDKFVWKPPEGWAEYRLPKFEEGLLKPGTEAPDFDLTLINKKRFKLSNCRGKIVWLFFWRVGCQPCRRELPHLERLHRRYKNKGLVILGFNCADDKKIVLNLFKKDSVSFLNIVDTSETAHKIYLTDYQKLKGMHAVPFNYIIDKDGKIVDAWYGDDVERGLQAIEKLGIK